MRRRVIIASLQCVAAVLALGGLYTTILFHVMRRMSQTIYNLQQIGLVVIAATTAAVLISLRRWSIPIWAYAAAAMLTLVAGFTPLVVDEVSRRQAIAAEQAERTARVAKFVAGLEARRQDIEARIAAQRPYSPQEAMDFLVYLKETNVSRQRGRNYSEDALEMLQRALEGKVIDPNGMVKGQRPTDTAPEPLFIHFYKERVLRGSPRWIETINWKAMKLLAQNGADLSLPAAAPLAADLRKTETEHHFGLFIELK